MVALALGQEVIEFLHTKKPSTYTTYQSGLRWFLRYYRKQHGDTAILSQFLDLLDENASLPRRQRKRLAETEINEFIDYLADQKKSNNSIRVYFTSVQNFLKYKGFDVSGKFVRLPSPVPKEENEKHPWKLEEIKAYVNVANNMRDKAIILCLFQSGLSISDLCNLNYGDVQEELEAGTRPLYLRLFRQKTAEEFKTFFGRDAVKYLKLYLETRTTLNRKAPLFTMAGSNTTRITEGAIQQRFREYVKELSFIQDHELEGYNPCRPHSLRSAFRSRLTGKTDPDLIEFFMGHAIGGVKRAYLNLPIDELRELYANFEHLLAIEKTSKEELMDRKGTKIPAKFQQEVEELKTTVKTMSQTIQQQDDETKQLRQEQAILKRQNAKFQKLWTLAFHSVVEHIYLVEQLAAERGVSVEEVLGLTEEQKTNWKRIMTADQQELEAWIVELDTTIKQRFGVDLSQLEKETPKEFEEETAS